jgi:diguanylate cyclase (GGDEF)-like protein
MRRSVPPVPILGLLSAGLALAVAGVALRGVPGAAPRLIGDWGLAACIGASAVACTWRAISNAVERIAWAVLAVGMWSYALGTVVFAGWIKSLEHAPFPSVSDWMWLALPVLSLVAFVMVGRQRGLGFRITSVLDGVIVATAFSGLVAALVYQPVYHELLQRGAAFGMVPPLSDVAAVSALVVALATRRWRPEPCALLAAGGFMLIAFGDTIYSLAAASTGWAPGTWLDLPYAAGTVLVALAAWVPAGRFAVAPVWELRAMAIPLSAGCAAVGLVAVSLFVGLNPVAEVSILLLVSAVVARMGFALHGSGRLLRTSEHEAQTDPLTGLGNRRRLMRDLASRPAEVRSLVLFDLDGFKNFNDTHGHAAGDELLALLAGRLRGAVRSHGRAYRMGGDEFCILIPFDRRDLHARAVKALETKARGIEVTCSWGEVVIPTEARSPGEALRLADRRMYAMKNGRPSAPGAQLREALTRVMSIREPDLHEHVIDVGRLAAEVARALQVPEHELVDIVHAAELHDVGKLAIPQAILDKPGPLDSDEWVVMKRHTLLGEQLLSGIPALANAARLVRASHEAWDGTGYPDGLAGREIPFGARIIAVCDAYDAMVTDRPYRDGMSRDAAVLELRRCAGTQFDPDVVGQLLAVLPALYRRDRVVV